MVSSSSNSTFAIASLAHPIVQQHQRVRTLGQTMSGRPVPSQLDQVSPRLLCQPEKPAPYHPFGRIMIAPFGKGDLRILGESGYNKDDELIAGVLREAHLAARG